jgi:hypothetical protein
MKPPRIFSIFAVSLCVSASLCAVESTDVAPAANSAATPTPTPTTAQVNEIKQEQKPAEQSPDSSALAMPTDADIALINWHEFSIDNAWENPFAADFSSISDFEERQIDWDKFIALLAAWPPGQVPKTEEKVRNLMCVAVLEDMGQGMFEAELPLYLYTRFRREIPDKTLKNILLITAYHPQHGSIIETAPELNLNIGLGEAAVRERLQILAVKMLGRMLGKLPITEEGK